MKKIDKILTLCGLFFTLIWLLFFLCNTIMLSTHKANRELYEERGLLSICVLLMLIAILAGIKTIRKEWIRLKL